MRRLILTLTLALAMAPGFLFAQEGEKKAGHEANQTHEKPESGNLEIWKWVNFLILAGGLGYLIGKNAGPFFASRSASIRKDMEVSQQQRKEAEARAAEVERRLATLETEIARLRSESEGEMKAGAARISQQTAEEIAKIQAHAGQEIAAAGKHARSDLKRYSAELAMGLAEQKVRARMTPGTQDELVDSFVRDLK
jgi:F0F1-type ATP synthase membrane subunit b/b'